MLINKNACPRHLLTGNIYIQKWLNMTRMQIIILAMYSLAMSVLKKFDSYNKKRKQLLFIEQGA